MKCWNDNILVKLFMKYFTNSIINGVKRFKENTSKIIGKTNIPTILSFIKLKFKEFLLNLLEYHFALNNQVSSKSLLML